MKPSECENVTIKKKKRRSSTRDSIRQVKSLHYVTVKKSQCRGLTVVLTKTSGLRFEHLKVNAQT